MNLYSFWRMYRSHFKATILLAWPIIIGQLGQVLLGVIDLAMVGKVGPVEIAAAGVSNAVFYIISIIGIGVSTAISPLVSIAVSRDDKKETAGILRGAYASAAVVSVGVFSILLFLSFHLDWFGQAENVAVMASSFLRIIALSTIPMIFFLCAKQFTDGLSLTWVSMIITLLALPLNAGINWLLIYGNAGFPEMGLDGAGYATLITRFAMLLAIYLYIRYSKRTRAFIMETPAHVREYFTKIMKLGIPSGLQYFFEVTAFGGAAIMAGWVAEDSEQGRQLAVNSGAAHQIAINLASITYMTATGLAAAGSIRVGAAMGGYSRSDARIAGKSALYIGTVWMIVCGLIFFLIPRFLVSFYLNESDPAAVKVEELAVQLLFIAGLFQLSDGIQCIDLGLLRGLGDVKIPAVLTLAAYWVIAIPLAFILRFYFDMGVLGIWIGLLVGLTISAVLLTRRFYLLAR